MVVVSSTFSAPATGILFQTSGTKLLVNDQELGTATLYVTEHNVVWGGGQLPSGAPAPTITLAYPHISLHAIQRDPSPALYMVLSYELRVPQLEPQGAGDAPADDDDEDFDGELSPITQLRFIPPNEGELTDMYEAMNQGQQLHPDPEDEAYMDGEDIDEGDEEEFEDAEENSPSAEEAAARLRHLRLENANGGQHYEDNGVDDGIDDDE